jgi:hypothetical protein
MLIIFGPKTEKQQGSEIQEDETGLDMQYAYGT